MMALVKLCYVCVYDFYNVMYSSDPQLLTWLLNRKAPTVKEESNHKEEEEEDSRLSGAITSSHVTA